MPVFPKNRGLPDGMIIASTLGSMSMGSIPLRGSILNAGSAWPSANLAIYIPFRVTRAFTFNSIAICIGSAAGNLDAGVYNADGTKIVSTGSTAVGANVNTISVTSTTLGPGLYYFALACSSTSCQPMCYAFTSTAKAGIIRALGVSQQASALPLPATMTPAANTGSIIPVMGITNRSFI